MSIRIYVLVALTAIACTEPAAPIVMQNGRLYISHPNLNFNKDKEVEARLTNSGKGEVVVLAIKADGPFIAETEWELPFSIEPGEHETLAISAKKAGASGGVTITFRESKGGEQKTQRLALKSMQKVVAKCVTDNPCREVFVDAKGICQERTRTTGSCSDNNEATRKDRCVGGNCIGLRKDGLVVPDSAASMRVDPEKALMAAAKREVE